MQVIVYGNIRVKKNSKRIVRTRYGQTRLISSRAYQTAENDILSQLYQFKASNAVETVSKPCSVSFDLYFQSKARLDLDNAIQGYLDCLVDAGILVDDKKDVVSEIHVRFAGIDPKNPRAIIRIEPLTGSLTA